MAVLETLDVAIPGHKNKASSYNGNFTKMKNYIEASVTEMNQTITSTLSIYQTVEIPSATSGTINLETNKIYSITPTAAITFNLPTISGDNVGKFHQIYVQMNLPTVYSIDFGTDWGFNDVEPIINTIGKYNIIYEYDGDNWVCGIIKRSEVS